MGRLTLRKFYLLLSEFYYQQQLQDIRFYRLLCCHFKEAPEAGDVFPMLKMDAVAQEADVDDELAFRQVTAALMPNREFE